MYAALSVSRKHALTFLAGHEVVQIVLVYAAAGVQVLVATPAVPASLGLGLLLLLAPDLLPVRVHEGRTPHLVMLSL